MNVRHLFKKFIIFLADSKYCLIAQNIFDLQRGLLLILVIMDVIIAA